MQQLTVRLHTTIFYDCPILVLSEYRNFTTSVRQKTLTKHTPIVVTKRRNHQTSGEPPANHQYFRERPANHQRITSTLENDQEIVCLDVI